MKKLLSLLILLTKLYAFTAYSQENSLLSPDIWLRSDRLAEHGIYWQDVSGNHRHALSAKKFSMSENLINFHPVISFDGVNDQMKMFYDISHFSRLTVILAFHNTDTISEQGVWSLDAGSKQVSALTNKNLLRASGAVTYPVKKRGIPTVNSSVQSWTKKRNKSNDIMFIVGGAVLADSTASLFKGSIAECLVFDKYLSKDEILKIESYLGIKYGVTLFESDYIASTGDTVWNYRQNRKYSNSIAGIGKDSIFGLNQKQSCSTAGEEELAIAAGKLTASNTSNTFNLKEGAYLLWGHNGGEMAYGQLEKGSIAGLYPVLERRWLVQSKTETDKIPTTLKFKTPENFKDYAAQCMLVIDRSGKGDFSSKAIEYITASKADENGDLYFENIH